ncbi:MAG TPA: hypothetical protein VLE99_00535 [Candidatus Saccharimonadales bacterium]|nr:hypothetical protein [Candidatus Saccharimonadales bacterium]
MAQLGIGPEPRRRRKSDDDPYADDGNWAPAHDFRRPSVDLGKSTDDTLNNIDRTLADQEAQAPDGPDGGGAGSSGDEEEPGKPAGEGDKSNQAAKGLKDQEEKPEENRYGPSARDDMQKTLGKGYTGEGKKKGRKTNLSRLYNGKSKTGKRIALLGAAAGGSLLTGAILFLIMLPLKITTMVDNLESHFSAAADQAVSTQVGNMFSNWVTKDILPNIGKGTCHTTADATCVSVASGTSPIAKMYNAWKQSKLEQKLATDHGFILGMSGKQRYIAFPDDHKFTLSDKEVDDLKTGRKSIFDLGQNDLHPVSRNQLRQAVMSPLDNETFFRRIILRFKLGTVLKKYGVDRCFVACKIRDNLADRLDKALLPWIGRAVLFQRAVLPAANTYGLIMECIMSDPVFCQKSLSASEPGDDQALNPLQRQIRQNIADFKALHEGDDIAKLIDTIKTASQTGGIKKAVTKAIVSKIASKFVSQELADKLGEKAIPVLGWVLLISAIVGGASSIGFYVHTVSYAADAQGAVNTFETYKSAVSEAQSGNGNLAALGSLTDTLSTNLSGSTDDQADATSTPLYNALFNNSQTGTGVTALFGGNAYADTASRGTYKCDDGNPVPTGDVVCPEEKFDRGNQVTDSISSITNDIPGLAGSAKVVNSLSSTVHGAIGDITGPVFDSACKTIGLALGCPFVMDEVGKATADVSNWAEDQFVVTPFTKNMSGGRSFDMAAAGADVVAQNECKEALGCKKASKASMNAIYSQQAAEAQQEFESKPMFARMFDTTTPYSLISRLALAMPTNLLDGTNNLASFFMGNPLGRLAGLFSSIFSRSTTFAAVPVAGDPFGITQYYMPDIPNDADAYWNANCADPSNPDQIRQSVIDARIADEGANANDETGEYDATNTSPCFLIQTATEGAGGKYDSSLIPKDEQNE